MNDELKIQVYVKLNIHKISYIINYIYMIKIIKYKYKIVFSYK